MVRRGTFCVQRSDGRYCYARILAHDLVLAAIYGQLDEHEAARNALRSLLELRPGFAATSREDLAIWWEPDLVEHLIDGLRKAGLQIPARETGLHLTTTRKQVS